MTAGILNYNAIIAISPSHGRVCPTVGFTNVQEGETVIFVKDFGNIIKWHFWGLFSALQLIVNDGCFGRRLICIGLKSGRMHSIKCVNTACYVALEG